MSNSRTINADQLCNLTTAILVKVGTPKDHAELVAHALVDADIEGLSSHGIMLLPMYVERIEKGSVDPTATGVIVTDAGARIVMDGADGLGQVTALRAAQIASDRAKEFGFGLVAVRNAFHFGAAGRFAKIIAQNGQIGIVMANTRPLLPAPGGAERVVGNNPISFAVPTENDPIVLDLALSAGAMGKIRLAEAQGKPIPDGWAATAEGLPTTDPAQAIAGMLLPAAGAKGFGLAMIIDLLTGGLSSGAIGKEVRPLYGDLSLPYRSANLFIAIEIEGLRSVNEFRSVASEFANEIRNSKRAPGTDSIRVPGDRAALAHKKFEGECSLALPTVASLQALATRLGIPLPNSIA